MSTNRPTPPSSSSVDRAPSAGPFDRRRFLMAGAMAAVTLACSSVDNEGSTAGSRTTGPSTSSTEASTDAAPASAADTGSSTSSAQSPSSATTGFDAAPLTANDFDDLAVCQALPESTAGPFPLDEQLLRADIAEGYPGHRLRLGLRVVDADCRPVPGVAVEIWHTDATGDYSAFDDGGGGKDEGPGTTFMRGTQPVNGDGIAEFATIYPGWYRGRAPHIHFRVRLDDHAVFTSQLYFPDDYSSEVYTQEPYAEFGPADTTNATDRIAGDVATNGLLLTVTQAAEGSLALANLAIIAA